MDSSLRFDKGTDKKDAKTEEHVSELRKIVYRGLLKGFWKRSIFRHAAGQNPTINAARSFRDKKTPHTRPSARDKNSYVNVRSALFLISRKQSSTRVVYGLQKAPKKKDQGSSKRFGIVN